ncbi:MAG: flagellar protein FlaG [Gammaproteobacteria bacterium]
MNPLESLKAVSAQIDSYLRSVGRTLDFTVDEQSGHPIITVRDSSGEVIRQIPNEEALRLARSLGAKPNVLVDLLV